MFNLFTPAGLSNSALRRCARLLGGSKQSGGSHALRSSRGADEAVLSIMHAFLAAVFRSWRVWYMGLVWGLMTTGMNAIIFWCAHPSSRLL